MGLVVALCRSNWHQRQFNRKNERSRSHIQWIIKEFKSNWSLSKLGSGIFQRCEWGRVITYLRLKSCGGSRLAIPFNRIMVELCKSYQSAGALTVISSTAGWWLSQEMWSLRLRQKINQTPSIHSLTKFICFFCHFPGGLQSMNLNLKILK